jgi:hypothetical protein
VKPFCTISLFLVAFTAACDGGSSGNTTACTTGSGTTKTCVELSGIPSEAVLGQTDACVSSGGVASSSCSHLGADGGCRVKSTAPGASQTVTTWMYAGNADNERLACTSNGQTWITP